MKGVLGKQVTSLSTTGLQFVARGIESHYIVNREQLRFYTVQQRCHKEFQERNKIKQKDIYLYLVISTRNNTFAIVTLPLISSYDKQQ